MATTLVYIFAANLLFVASSILGLDLGISLTLISLSKDIKSDVHGLNRRATAKDNQLKISKQFTELIEIHSDAKQLRYQNDVVRKMIQNTERK